MSVSIEAARALGRGDYDKVISLCNKSLETNPGEISSLQMLRHCYSQKGDRELGFLFANKVIELEPENFESLFHLANYYLDLKDFENTYHFACKLSELKLEPITPPRWFNILIKVTSFFSKNKKLQEDCGLGITKLNNWHEANIEWAKEFKHWYESNQDAIIAHGKAMDEKP